MRRISRMMGRVAWAETLPATDDKRPQVRLMEDSRNAWVLASSCSHTRASALAVTRAPEDLNLRLTGLGRSTDQGAWRAVISPCRTVSILRIHTRTRHRADHLSKLPTQPSRRPLEFKAWRAAHTVTMATRRQRPSQRTRRVPSSPRSIPPAACTMRTGRKAKLLHYRK